MIVQIPTVTNYTGEYQGSMTVQQILSAAGLSSQVAIICCGMGFNGDGSIHATWGYDGSAFGFSGKIAGTYSASFIILYR